MSDDLTLRILGEIRDGVRATNQRLDQTNQRLDQTNQRLDQARTELRDEIAQTRTEIAQTRNELLARIADTDLRLGTGIINLNASTRDVHDLFTERFDLRDRVERCEHDIAEIKNRLA